MPQVKQLTWSKRPYISETDAGRQRMWTAKTEDGSRYTVSELATHGYPVYFIALFHHTVYDPILKQDTHRIVWVSKREQRLRSRVSAQTLCQRHFRQHALSPAKPRPKRKRSSPAA